MTALVRSELLKIRTTRAWWAYLVVIVLLTGIGTAGSIGSAEIADRSTLSFQLDLVSTAGVSVLMAIILGITIITTEFRHGTVTPTFLAEPRRERVILSKAIAAVVVAIGFALLVARRRRSGRDPLADDRRRGGATRHRAPDPCR